MGRKPPSRPNLQSPQEPWVSFLRALDGVLNDAVQLHCIGGFVITMHFGLSRETSDIDILAAVPHGQLALLQRLGGQGSELHQQFKVYLQPVTVATYPEDYESRLLPMWTDLKLKNVRLLALEAHDLALTKLERNSDVDRQDVLALAGASHLDPATIRERYFKEFRPNVVSGAERLDLTLKLWTDMCWPDAPMTEARD